MLVGGDMAVVVGAILLVASFGTYNIISTITHEKARDIAIMKSLGFRESTVRGIFVVESALIGLSGAILGWGLGYLLCLALIDGAIRDAEDLQDMGFPIWHRARNAAGELQ